MLGTFSRYTSLTLYIHWHQRQLNCPLTMIGFVLSGDKLPKCFELSQHRKGVLFRIFHCCRFTASGGAELFLCRYRADEGATKVSFVIWKWQICPSTSVAKIVKQGSEPLFVGFTWKRFKTWNGEDFKWYPGVNALFLVGIEIRQNQDF